MKKSFILLLAFFGVMAFLVAPGKAVADGPIQQNGFIPPLNNTFDIPNTGATYHGEPLVEFGSVRPIDCHGDASPYMRDPNGALNNGHFTSGPLYNGAVVLWEGASLPSLPTTLDALLSSPDGNKVNDLLVFYGGSSYVWLISEPAINFLPFEDPSSDKHALWTTVNLVYEQNAKAISADLTKAYTVYQPQTINDPGWDPTVPDRDYYTVPDRWNSDYPPPSTWTQYIFNVANDRVQVPEPGALLLLGFGLMAVAGMRRVVKAKA